MRNRSAVCAARQISGSGRPVRPSAGAVSTWWPNADRSATSELGKFSSSLIFIPASGCPARADPLPPMLPRTRSPRAPARLTPSESRNDLLDTRSLCEACEHGAKRNPRSPNHGLSIAGRGCLRIDGHCSPSSARTRGMGSAQRLRRFESDPGAARAQHDEDDHAVRAPLARRSSGCGASARWSCGPSAWPGHAWGTVRSGVAGNAAESGGRAGNRTFDAKGRESLVLGEK